MVPRKDHNPVAVHFGCGVLDRLPHFLPDGKSVLLTTPGSAKRGLVERLQRLAGGKIRHVFAEVAEYPTFKTLRSLYQNLHRTEPETIIAVGGGSVLDSAKVLAIRGKGLSFDAIENVLRGQGDLGGYEFLPVIAVPTTAGTGSEVTPYATVWDFEEKRKYSLNLDDSWPKQALVDPELTLTLPRDLTLYTGLDALSHSLEAIWNRNAGPFSDEHAVWAAKTILETLPALLTDLQNLALRTEMAEASLRAGLAIGSTQTALAHALSYSLTAKKGLPHGLACSFTLEKVLSLNYGVSPQVDGNLRKIFGGDEDVMKAKLRDFFSKLQVVTRLSDYGVDPPFLIEELEKIFSNPRFGNNINQDRDKIRLELVKP